MGIGMPLTRCDLHTPSVGLVDSAREVVLSHSTQRYRRTRSGTCAIRTQSLLSAVPVPKLAME